MPTITPLPDPPSRSDPVNFAVRADAFMAALPVMVNEFNTAAFGTAADLSASLAGTSAGQGASLVALQGGGTVQDFSVAATSKGAYLVAYKPSVGLANRTVQARLDEAQTLMDFGAAGTGAGDDVAALTAVAAAARWGVPGNWKTYAVSSTTNINRVKEAVFLKGGFAELPPVTAAQFGGSVTVNRFGGQLGQLLRRLADPLCQSVNITLSGDSITWGTGATGQAASGTRDGTLSDPRNNYGCGSWANTFKRWVGAFLGTGATVALSNHAAAPSGESIATWTKSIAVYPNGVRFTKTVTGSGTDTEVADVNTLCNRRRLLSVAINSKIKLAFQFSGDTIEIVFGCITNGANYNLYVNGVAVATAQPTRSGVSGLTAGYSRSWTHTFTRVVDALVELEVVHHDNVTGIDALYLEALRLPKRVRISNQGIIGATSASVLTYHMPTTRETGTGLKPITQWGSVTETPTGTTSKVDRDSPGSSTGWQTIYGQAPSGGASWDLVIPVNSTKDKFEIRYSSLTTSCDILVIVGGTTIDSFSTNSLAPGGVYGYNRQRVITLPGGTTSVTLRTVTANYTGGAAYNNYFLLEGLANYTASDITYPTNNGFSDGLAFATDDDFGFIAIGTNDRTISTTAVNSPHALGVNVESILNLTPTKLQPIIITPPPALVDGSPTMYMSAREAGNVLRELGQRRSVDVINLQSLFLGQAYDMWAPDGLHPGDLGHKVYADAVIQAIEGSD